MWYSNRLLITYVNTFGVRNILPELLIYSIRSSVIFDECLLILWKDNTYNTNTQHWWFVYIMS